MILSQSPHSSTGTARGLLRRRINNKAPYALFLAPNDSSFSYDVTILTRPTFKRSVNHTFEELRIFRSVGVMAVSTIHDSGFDIEMSFSKGRLLRIMALPAQGLNRLVHQSGLG